MELLVLTLLVCFFWLGYWAGGRNARYKENEMRVKNKLTWADGVEYGKSLEK